MADDIILFDRRAARAHRERAARLDPAGRFLRHEIQARLVDRIGDLRGPFERVLDLGSGDGGFGAMLELRAGRKLEVVTVDPAFAFARHARCAVVAEEEALPLAPESFDLAVSTLGLHWINDLPGALIQLRRILRPDGVLLAAMFGGATLHELRSVLAAAELEVSGGAAPRVAPFADAYSVSGLVQRAGFALPVVDTETITLTYAHPYALMAELRAMGETNAIAERVRRFTGRAVFRRAAEIYAERFGVDGGRIAATFEIITLTAWAPSSSQPRPLQPGSAAKRLADLL